MHHTHQQQTRGVRGHTLPTLMQEIRKLSYSPQTPCYCTAVHTHAIPLFSRPRYVMGSAVSREPLLLPRSS